MPITPGLAAIPSVLVNTALSLVPDASYAVRSADSLAVISPMYNEEAGAERALRSLLGQSTLPEELALSINGGSDDTYGVVARLLREEGYERREVRDISLLQARAETWLSPANPLRVTVVDYRAKTSKSDSINNLVAHGFVAADRVLVVDGDTVFHPDFIRELRDNFYRLHVRTVRGRREVLLEDYALQSGSVTSFAPRGSSWKQVFISRGRQAEYAFAGVLRRGQAKQLGGGPLWGRSRLYTAIGCGFAARRDRFPMPIETETEDHDFTLTVQDQPETLQRVSPADLEARGFRFVIDGRVLRPAEVFDAQDTLTFKRGSSARFVERALMATEDPPHFNGFIRQVERWNGGGQQAVLKRLGRRLAPNVRFTLWLSLLENLLGLVVLGLLPLLLALNHGNPSLGLSGLTLATWLGSDALITGALVAYGFYRQRRARGVGALRALPSALGLSLVTTLPFLVLRYLNPVTYLASATRVVPEHLRRRRQRPEITGVVWERGHARRRTRSEGVFAFTVSGMAVCALGVVQVAPYLNPVNADAWRLTYRSAYVDLRQHDQVPVMTTSVYAMSAPAPEPDRVAEARSYRREPRHLSAFCDPSYLRSAATERRTLSGDADAYTPLSSWGLMTLARLAPLLAYLETAATAYDIPVGVYLQILLTESYLDPLAIGPSEDKGLSQVTSDALTMLKALALEPSSPYFNPRLVPERFSVFDPDFSLCAGAAKLAWAYEQPGVENDQQAYALYINPLDGFVGGRVSERHQPLTEEMMRHEPMVAALAATIAAYQEDPGRVSEAERRLLNTARLVSSGRLTLEQAYRASYAVAQANDLGDEAMYEAMFTRYFGNFSLTASLP